MVPNKITINELVGCSPCEVQGFQRGLLVSMPCCHFLFLFVSLSKRQLEFRVIQCAVVPVPVHEEAYEHLFILAI